MPIIRATCPTCGDVEFSQRLLKVMVCSTTGEASYGFRCPACNLLVSKPTDKQVVELLISTGVTVSFWSLPEEIYEQHKGAPISYDDLIEFHYLLNTGVWNEQLECEMQHLARHFGPDGK